MCFIAPSKGDDYPSVVAFLWLVDAEIILIMHSISPHIIKHYIPLDFSKEVIDLHVLPRQQKQAQQDNPFHNMKLKNLDATRQRQLVLTFKNKSNSVYRSRRSVKYKQLFQELQEQHQKIAIIKEQIQKSDLYERKKAKQAANITQTARKKQTVGINQFEIEIEGTEKKVVKCKTSRDVRSEHQRESSVTPLPFGTEKKGTIKRRLYSSLNFRDYSKRVAEESWKNSKDSNLFNYQSLKPGTGLLKIRGRRAPEKQTVDPYKRASTSSTDNIIRIHGFDRI